MLSRTRLFGIAIVLYALVVTGLICVDLKNFTFNVNTNALVAAGGIIMLLSGFYMAIKEDFDKLKAIGLYAVSFAIFKILRAYSAMTIDPSYLDLTKIQWVDIVSFATIIMAILLLAFGISFLRGTAKNIWRKVILSAIFIILNCVTFYGAYENNDTNLMLAMGIEILVLVLFIALLLSKDVRINTVGAKKKYGKKISKEEERKAEQDYKLAMSEAKALRKAGNKEAAKKVEQDAKEDYQRRVEDSEELRKKATKARYVYNPETKRVEVVDDDNDGKE